MAGKLFLTAPDIESVSERIAVCEDRIMMLQNQLQHTEKELFLTQQAYQQQLLGKDHELLDETACAIEMHKSIKSRLMRQIQQTEMEMIDYQLFAETLSNSNSGQKEQNEENEKHNVAAGSRPLRAGTKYSNVW